ncbi:MAG TPA: hypothetical protein PK228_15340 [Saprospiraceae bacterium]|nr:hypothetical protein [Saprospiraceae bacterium]
MKANLLFFIAPVVSLALLTTCCTTKKQASGILEKSGIRCDFDLGDYRLKHPSVLVMPYENKKWAVFTDSLGRLDTFNISFAPKKRSRQMHYVYNGFMQGDTVRYCYMTQYYHCLLESESLKLQFKITVAARPLCLDEQRVCPDAASKTPIDMLDVSYCDVAKPGDKYHYGIFHKVMGSQSDTNSHGERLLYPEIEFFGRIFKSVERIDYGKKNPYIESGRSKLYYSTSDGIVAFSINNGKFWRLSTMY